MKTQVVALLAPVTVLTSIALFGQLAQARPRGAVGNKQIVRRAMEEMFNQGNPNAVDTYVTANFVDHQASPGAPPTREGLKQLLTNLRTAFPDLHVTIDDIIAEGDKVVVRATMHGTQKGELRLGPGPALPPTGKRFTMQMIDIIRLRAGKAVEHWGNEDDLGMMQQLGVIPPPGEPARQP
jgi:predicted ester cyclase